MDFSLRLYVLHRAKKLLEKRSFKYKRALQKKINILLPSIKENFTVKTLKGFKLIIDPKTDKGIEYNIFRDGEYERGTLEAFECIIKKGDVVIDLGGNIGLTSVYASILTGKKGKVFSFEAHPETYKILKKNLKLNKCNNVTAKNLAISDTNCKGVIYDNLDVNRGAASLIKKNKGQKSYQTYITTLDNIVSENGIEKVDFIKIDIEGYELKALKGFEQYLKIHPKPSMCIELSFDVNSNEAIEEIFSILTKQHNYLAFKQKKGKSRGGSFIEIIETNELPRFDNIYFFQKEQLSFIKNIEISN
jgi:FkbM family methyltransferase